MAEERESPEQKNRRLHRMLHEVLDTLFDRKLGNSESFGESRLVVTWKAGNVTDIRIEDSASVR